jgi:dipeptidyl aminopeptidase/acylaminoacyl peptidase
MARAPGSDRERDLSWFDGSGASDISPDGRLLLMSEFGEAGGSRYSAYVRPMNGDAAVRLGDGYGVSLSPDGTAALVIVPGAPARLTIVPLGAGQTRVLERGDINDYEFASWLPDGKTIVFNGRTAKSAMRLYRQDAGGGVPMPLGPPNVRLAQPSRPTAPDGKRLAVIDDAGGIVIINADGSGAPRPVPKQNVRLRPVAWSSCRRSSTSSTSTAARAASCATSCPPTPPASTASWTSSSPRTTTPTPTACGGICRRCFFRRGGGSGSIESQRHSSKSKSA